MINIIKQIITKNRKWKIIFKISLIFYLFNIFYIIIIFCCICNIWHFRSEHFIIYYFWIFEIIFHNVLILINITKQLTQKSLSNQADFCWSCVKTYITLLNPLYNLHRARFPLAIPVKPMDLACKNEGRSGDLTQCARYSKSLKSYWLKCTRNQPKFKTFFNANL